MALAPAEASRRLRAICATAPVMPVLVIEDDATAQPLAEALIGGGLPVLEVTLRTPAAPDVIREMASVVGGIVGAGTIVTPADVAVAVEAGARFAVSPGATDQLLDACAEAELPLLPGAATASEAMRLFARGHDLLKFFPAEAAGGVAALRALAGPLPGIAFCPTGGVSARNAASYLALPNVACVGGSWIAPVDLIAAGDYGAITALARAAAALCPN